MPTYRELKARPCYDCGEPKDRAKHALTLRCWPCNERVVRIRARAHADIQKLVKAGAMKAAEEQTCPDCGAPAKHFDHRDYSRPLDVVAVCHGCNLRRGPAKSLGPLPADFKRRQHRAAALSTPETAKEGS